jgi:hypothetical protein
LGKAGNPKAKAKARKGQQLSQAKEARAAKASSFTVLAYYVS